MSADKLDQDLKQYLTLNLEKLSKKDLQELIILNELYNGGITYLTKAQLVNVIVNSPYLTPRMELQMIALVNPKDLQAIVELERKILGPEELAYMEELLTSIDFNDFTEDGTIIDEEKKKKHKKNIFKKIVSKGSKILKIGGKVARISGPIIQNIGQVLVIAGTITGQPEVAAAGAAMTAGGMVIGKLGQAELNIEKAIESKGNVDTSSLELSVSKSQLAKMDAGATYIANSYRDKRDEFLMRIDSQQNYLPDYRPEGNLLANLQPKEYPVRKSGESIEKYNERLNLYARTVGISGDEVRNVRTVDLSSLPAPPGPDQPNLPRVMVDGEYISRVPGPKGDEDLILDPRVQPQEKVEPVSGPPLPPNLSKEPLVSTQSNFEKLLSNARQPTPTQEYAYYDKYIKTADKINKGIDISQKISNKTGSIFFNAVDEEEAPENRIDLSRFGVDSQGAPLPPNLDTRTIEEIEDQQVVDEIKDFMMTPGDAVLEDLANAYREQQSKVNESSVFDRDYVAHLQNPHRVSGGSTTYTMPDNFLDSLQVEDSISLDRLGQIMYQNQLQQALLNPDIRDGELAFNVAPSKITGAAKDVERRIVDITDPSAFIKTNPGIVQQLKLSPSARKTGNENLMYSRYTPATAQETMFYVSEVPQTSLARNQLYAYAPRTTQTSTTLMTSPVSEDNYSRRVL